MKLWLLRPIKHDHPLWDPWYDKAFGFVVSAKTEERARELAQGDGGDEVGCGDKRHPAWTDPANSTCQEIVADDIGEGVVIRDYASA